MTREDRQEALSLAYFLAVAGQAGMTHSMTSKDYGIDLVLREVEVRDRRYFDTGARLDVQLMSTTACEPGRGSFGPPGTPCTGRAGSA